MKIFKKILNVVIAFILTILIMINFGIILLSSTILNKEYALDCLEKSGYYGKLETDLKNGFEDYKYQSGLPDSVFEGLYSQDLLKRDTQSIIEGIYNNKEVDISSDSVKNKLQENINMYVSQEKIELTEEEQKNIDDFANIIVRSL